MCKQPDESLIGQCEHNITQGFLLVSLLWYQKVVFDKSPMLSLSLYLGLFFISIHQQCILFWIGIDTLWWKLIRGKIKLVHEVDLVCDHLHNTKRLWVTNREPPELSQYRFKRVWRTAFTRTLLNHAPSSTQLHPPQLSSFQPPSSSLQHLQQFPQI